MLEKKKQVDLENLNNLVQKQVKVIQSTEKDEDLARRASEVTVSLLNRFRQEKRLQAVKMDEEVYVQCLIHSKFQLKNRKLTHDGFSDRIKNLPYSSETSAENVAMFTMTVSTAEEIAAQFMTQWKNSKGHYENMIKPSVANAAVAIAISGNTHYATMILTQP